MNRMKTLTINGTDKESRKYVSLIDLALREFKEIQKELRQEQAKTERLRASSRRTMNETWEILRRVETTL
jgi:hypothetical protein